MELNDFLQQVFQQYGLLGLFLVFLMLGPGFAYFRTRTVRTQTEAKAQAILNEFIQQERQRADRLEQRLNDTLGKLDRAEAEVAKLRLRLAEVQSALDQVSALKRQIRKLTRRVQELEAQLQTKQAENEALQLEIARREHSAERCLKSVSDFEPPQQEHPIHADDEKLN